MLSFESKIDFKNLERKTILGVTSFVIITLFLAFFSKEISTKKNHSLTRTESIVITLIVDIIVIPFFLKQKSIKKISINEEDNLLLIDFKKPFKKFETKKIRLTTLGYKLETIKNQTYITLKDKNDFYFEVTEQEFELKTLKEICQTLEKNNSNLLE